jgi:hypothetical protein
MSDHTTSSAVELEISNEQHVCDTLLKVAERLRTTYPTSVAIKGIIDYAKNNINNAAAAKQMLGHADARSWSYHLGAITAMHDDWKTLAEASKYQIDGDGTIKHGFEHRLPALVLPAGDEQELDQVTQLGNLCAVYDEIVKWWMQDPETTPLRTMAEMGLSSNNMKPDKSAAHPLDDLRMRYQRTKREMERKRVDARHIPEFDENFVQHCIYGDHDLQRAWNDAHGADTLDERITLADKAASLLHNVDARLSKSNKTTAAMMATVKASAGAAAGAGAGAGTGGGGEKRPSLNYKGPSVCDICTAVALKQSEHAYGAEQCFLRIDDNETNEDMIRRRDRRIEILKKFYPDCVAGFDERRAAAVKANGGVLRQSDFQGGLDGAGARKKKKN